MDLLLIVWRLSTIIIYGMRICGPKNMYNVNANKHRHCILKGGTWLGCPLIYTVANLFSMISMHTRVAILPAGSGTMPHLLPPQVHRVQGKCVWIMVLKQCLDSGGGGQQLTRNHRNYPSTYIHTLG
jgi:hypothetical protein